MAVTLTEVDFELTSWHDCHVWRLDFLAGDPDEGDWTSELSLGIDFIVEWVCGVDRRATFRIAPATLVFHGVTDPRIAIDWGDTGHRVAIYPVSIDRVERQTVQDQKVHLDRPYYRWRIVLNSPPGGEISFGAAGFTQTLLAEPVPCDEQHLSPRERTRLTRGGT
jgi:hypothetical protein